MSCPQITGNDVFCPELGTDYIGHELIGPRFKKRLCPVLMMGHDMSCCHVLKFLICPLLKDIMSQFKAGLVLDTPQC